MTQSKPETQVLYSGAQQHKAFVRFDKIYPSSELTASTQPYQFSSGAPISLPNFYEFEVESLVSADFITSSDTSALLILKQGEIRHEQYWLTGGPDIEWISFSVAKSFIAALIGTALAEGKIGAISDPISGYVPGQAGSAYDGVAIVDVLQMSSGARWYSVGMISRSVMVISGGYRLVIAANLL